MGQYLLKLPKMGESVTEATVTKWLMEIGDNIVLDDAIVEIATDKVDTDVTSEVEGILIEKRVQENEVISVGAVMAIIEIEGDTITQEAKKIIEEFPPAIKELIDEPLKEKEISNPEVAHIEIIDEIKRVQDTTAKIINKGSVKFYSPLVRNIAQEEGILITELDSIIGTGLEGRVTKSDIIAHIKNKLQSSPDSLTNHLAKNNIPHPIKTEVNFKGNDQIVEMSRMEKMISDHMKTSIQTSAHVQSFIEVDVTNLWNWREEAKNSFYKRENEKLTFTPLFMTAIIKALRDFPKLNSSIQGDKIIIKQACLLYTSDAADE